MAQDNMTYDLVAVLYHKMKGVDAYEQYEQDFQNDDNLKQLLSQIKQQDEQHIGQLQQQLVSVLQNEGGTDGLGDVENQGMNAQDSTRSPSNPRQTAGR